MCQPLRELIIIYTIFREDMLFLVKFKVDSKNSVVFVIIIKLVFQFSLHGNELLMYRGATYLNIKKL